MKQFFENYGAVALGILALLVLIAMITPVGNIIKTSLQGTVHKFSSSIDAQTDTMTESMAQAFKNESQLSGIIDGKLYINGKVPWQLKQYAFSEDGSTAINTSTGNVHSIRLDVNGKIGQNGGPDTNLLRSYGIRFDLYYDGELIEQNLYDFSPVTTINDITKYSLLITQCPDNIDIQRDMIHVTLDKLAIAPQDSTIDFQFNIPFTIN